MTPTVEQVRQALMNTLMPPQNRCERAYKTLQHIAASQLMSKRNPGVDGTRASKLSVEVQDEYGQGNFTTRP